MNASSSPWNMAPKASNSETASPWAVSPIQKSNPFASRNTASQSAESDSELSIDGLSMKEDLPNLSAFSSAFEPKVEKAGELIAGSKAELGLHAGHFPQNSTWTSIVTEQVQVQKTEELIAYDKLAQQIPGFVPAKISAVAEDKVVEKSLLMGVQPQVENNEMRFTQAEASESAWTEHVDRDAYANVANKFSSKKVPSEEVADILKDQAIEEVTPFEELKKPSDKAPFEKAPAGLIAIKSLPRKDVIKATSDIRNTPLVQKAPLQEKNSIDAGETEEVINKAAEEIKGHLFKALSADKETEAAFCKDMTSLPTEDGACPWTNPPMQEEESNAAFSLTNFAQNAEESAPVVANIPEITEPPTNWVHNLVPGDIAVEGITNGEAVGPIEKLIFDGNLSSKIPILEDPELEKRPTDSLSWNTVPDQKCVKEIVTPVREVVVGPIKEDFAEPVQEPILFNQTSENFKDTMLLTQKISEAAAHEAEKASVGSETSERKATAEAFDCYIANSIVKVDKLSEVEAITANSTNAPEFCGISSCSIM
ncbi:hypothetical protein CCR75_008458 [Bremia lactucae]|uniref:Uncharacterized protein n=1 Tax=Bremia lactucae TaxID=4779 RepID=A0A976NZB0_BRELC|nr:hypothetical protein CCR75_008458 [Bremia lactucae]